MVSIKASLTLGGKEAPELPTDERLRRYATGASDPYLEALYFQYGRYLLISSSRTLKVPANRKACGIHTSDRLGVVITR